PARSSETAERGTRGSDEPGGRMQCGLLARALPSWAWQTQRVRDLNAEERGGRERRVHHRGCVNSFANQRPDRGGSRLAIAAAGPGEVLAAANSLGGLLSSAYARETPAWAAQAIGQDWFDVLIAAPWIAICGAAARRGSYRWGVVLAGGYGYVVYEL